MLPVGIENFEEFQADDILILTLLCSRLKGKKADATEVAAIIEICHTASLIHDDIIDDADTRRGQLSVQKKFGREMAVYCGDFMIFAAMGRTDLRIKPWYRAMFSRLEMMCDGEISQYDNQYNTDINEEKYMENIVGKTSAMFIIACEAGAYEGKCDLDEIEAIDEFAKNLGLLFQIRAAGGYGYTLKKWNTLKIWRRKALRYSETLLPEENSQSWLIISGRARTSCVWNRNVRMEQEWKDCRFFRSFHSLFFITSIPALAGTGRFWYTGICMKNIRRSQERSGMEEYL